jgi:hypothetical protein
MMDGEVEPPQNHLNFIRPDAVMQSQSLPRKLYSDYSNIIEKGLYQTRILPTKDLCLPDFLVIGSPQSGTTWLHRNLNCHPGLFLPAKKEIHYFDRHFDMRLKNYAVFFESGKDRVKGEITPDYGILIQDRIRFIHSIMPDVRLILMVRNPIDRAWSAARRVFSKRYEKFWEEIDEDEIYDFFKNQTANYDGDYEPSLNYGEYSKIINKWLSEFPAEQLFVGFFDDISRRPKALMEEILEFLDVHVDIDWDDFPLYSVFNKNPNVELPSKFKEYLEQLFSDDIESLADQYGEKVADWDR